VSKPHTADAVVFRGSVMFVAPRLACVVPLVAGWWLGVFGDVQSVIRPRTSFQLFVSLAAAFFPFSAFAVAHCCWNGARVRASVGWPTVTGRVERSEAEYGMGLYGGYWRLALAYRYTVGGREYEGDRLLFATLRFNRKDVAERLADKCPAGADVTVNYDPNDPVTAVLDASDELAWNDAWRAWLLLALPFIISVLN
jgi:hypothetical protein